MSEKSKSEKFKLKIASRDYVSGSLKITPLETMSRKMSEFRVWRLCLTYRSLQQSLFRLDDKPVNVYTLETSIMQIRDLLVSAHAHYQDTGLSLNHAHHLTMSDTKTEKYENISSRDYVPRYLKISCAETMSRLMGREHPAPKPFMDASIYFISRKDPKKKDP